MRLLPLGLLAICLPLLSSAPVAQQLQCDPCNVGFGHVIIGTSQTAYVQLTNVGHAFLKIKSKSKTGAAFSFGRFPLPLILAPGNSTRLPLKFRPTVPGWTSGSATLISNNGNDPLTIKLSGTGVALNVAQLTLTPASLDFGSVTVGNSVTLPVTLSASNGSVTISSADVTNPEFSVRGLTLPMTLASGQSVQIKLKFAPTAPGQASGKLVLYSDADNSPTSEALAGTGVAPNGHSAYLSWDPDKDPVIGYNVYRATKSGGPYTRLNGALDAATDYTDDTVTPGATYFYVVTAVDAKEQESGYSNQVKVVVPYP